MQNIVKRAVDIWAIMPPGVLFMVVLVGHFNEKYPFFQKIPTFTKFDDFLIFGIFLIGVYASGQAMLMFGASVLDRTILRIVHGYPYERLFLKLPSERPLEDNSTSWDYFEKSIYAMKHTLNLGLYFFGVATLVVMSYRYTFGLVGFEIWLIILLTKINLSIRYDIITEKKNSNTTDEKYLMYRESYSEDLRKYIKQTPANQWRRKYRPKIYTHTFNKLYIPKNPTTKITYIQKKIFLLLYRISFVISIMIQYTYVQLTSLNTSNTFSTTFIHNFTTKYNDRFIGKDIAQCKSNTFWLCYFYLVDKSESITGRIHEILRSCYFNRSMASCCMVLLIIFSLENAFIIKSEKASALIPIVLGFASIGFMSRFVHLHFNNLSKTVFRGFYILMTEPKENEI